MTGHSLRLQVSQNTFKMIKRDKVFKVYGLLSFGGVLGSNGLCVMNW